MKITDAQMFESLEFLRDDDRKVSDARARRLCRLLTDHHKARIDVWRSQSANDRFINQRI